MQSSIAQVFRALNESGARYLVAGGLAVVAHGYLRLTMDIDLIIQLGRENLTRALEALRALGYRPKAPVDIAEFSYPENRDRWINEKGMVVFQLVSDVHRSAPIDVFTQEPFDFDAVYAAAPRREVDDGVEIRVVPLAQLIEMKERANRPKDQVDLLYLRKLLRDAADT